MKKSWLLGGAAVLVVIVVAALWWWQTRSPTPVATAVPPFQQGDTPATTVAGEDHILGNQNAPVTIVEYASLTCPHCAAFHRETLPRIKQEWIDPGKAKLIFRNFPFDQPALRGAMLAECAGNERYFTFIDVMFQQQDSWSRAPDPVAALSRLAKLGGMSDDQIQACLKNEAISSKIVEGRLAAEKELGVTSTPTFFINGRKIVGAQEYSKFQEALQAAAPKS
jgi:protein-disulfide isomerase